MLNNLKSRNIIIFLFYFIKIILSQSERYCVPDLCKIWNGTDYNYFDHIGCDNNATLSNDCREDASMMIMTQKRLKLILELHNTARNKIALGLVNGYDSAENMPVIKWDKELEYLASLNVKTCQFEHDSCRNTPDYLYSGQNIGLSWQYPPFHSNSKRIKIVIGGWFNEYKDANQTFINSFYDHPENKMIGHFTLMISDRVKRVGCAAIRYSDPTYGRAFLMTCNYDFSSVYTETIYNSGLPASNCTVRASENYPGLCEWDEEETNDDSEESNEVYDNDLNFITELL